MNFNFQDVNNDIRKNPSKGGVFPKTYLHYVKLCMNNGVKLQTRLFFSNESILKNKVQGVITIGFIENIH